MDAYIFDKPLLQYYLLQNNNACSLTLTQDQGLEPFDYGMGFHVMFPQGRHGLTVQMGVLHMQPTSCSVFSAEIINDFGIGVLTLQSQNVLNSLQVSTSYFLTPPAHRLSMLFSQHNTESSVPACNKNLPPDSVPAVSVCR
jgi:hypothetical protein